ncbi:hypothetical protein QSJ18_04855 [Gordonia sp. ABSL1-1]|uniref:hypothetical protein n=1 Tax=Gordonia sp. ABSL1-1 TaxID=3053923 RepID=UPI0025723384|nr:hypothetical protein [Gordonia sp. ABSL1-1]MDL9936062.1 hypothetical protein [Gordonia sp. ABSL1-1]
MDIVEAISKVLLVGLLFGAGLPALFALGLRYHAQSEGDVSDDGTITAPSPALRALSYVLFGIVTLVIAVGILWITRQTIYYYTGVKLFPFGYK